MARSAFFSFHYKPDSTRAAQVRNMGLVEGNRPATDNAWKTVKRGGDAAIRRWIDGQMYGRSVAIFLIGQNTAGRKWIKYEIEKAWDSGKGVLGVHIHKLKDLQGKQALKGRNPFSDFKIGGADMAKIVKVYTPPALAERVCLQAHQKISAWVDRDGDHDSEKIQIESPSNRLIRRGANVADLRATRLAVMTTLATGVVGAISTIIAASI